MMKFVLLDKKGDMVERRSTAHTAYAPLNWDKTIDRSIDDGGPILVPLS